MSYRDRRKSAQYVRVVGRHPMSEKITLQQHAKDTLQPWLNQHPLMTLEHALSVLGWPYEGAVSHKPVCCGKPTEMEGILGTYAAYCLACGRTLINVARAPARGNSWVAFPDSDKIDIDGAGPSVFAAGVRPHA